jgi:hypothetical protein
MFSFELDLTTAQIAPAPLGPVDTAENAFLDPVRVLLAEDHPTNPKWCSSSSGR